MSGRSGAKGNSGRDSGYSRSCHRSGEHSGRNSGYTRPQRHTYSSDCTGSQSSHGSASGRSRGKGNTSRDAGYSRSNHRSRGHSDSNSRHIGPKIDRYSSDCTCTRNNDTSRQSSNGSGGCKLECSDGIIYF